MKKTNKKQLFILIAVAIAIMAALTLTLTLITLNTNKGRDEHNQKYTVTFDANADGVIGMPKKQSVKSGEFVSVPEIPSRNGYVFYGWFTYPEAEAWSQNPIDFSNYPINKDIKFYAVWYSDNMDEDGDGLSHANEQIHNTDAFKYDTDLDGLSDGDEINIYHTDPCQMDSDGDGISDGNEVALGINPLNSHSDGFTHDTERTLEALYQDFDNIFELKITSKANMLSTVSVQTFDNDVISDPAGLISPVIEIQYDKSYDFDSAKLVFDYSKFNLIGLNEDNLTFLYINEETGKYEEIPSIVDKERKLIISEPTHFSAYVVGDKKAVTEVVNYNPLDNYITINKEKIFVSEVVTTNFDVKRHGFAFTNFDAYGYTNGVCYGFTWVACLNYLERLPSFGLSSLLWGEIVPSYNLHNDSRYTNNRLYIESEKNIFNKSNNYTWYGDNQEANAISETLNCIVNIWDKQPLLSDQIGQNLNKSTHFQKLIDNLKNDIPVPLTLYGYREIKWQPDIKVAHSVLAYGLYHKCTPNGIIYYILIYDCNYPGQKRYITAVQNSFLHNTYTLSYEIYDNIHISDPLDITDDESLFIKHTITEEETTKNEHENILESKGLDFLLNSNQTSYSVRGIGSCMDTEIIIPAEYQGLPVTSVFQKAFNNCTNITSVTFPSSITKIDYYAFANCTSLKKVVFNEGLEEIGFYAFLNCHNLNNISFPNSIKYLSVASFYNCKNLSNITFQESIPKMSIGTFSLTGVTFNKYKGGTYFTIHDNPYFVLVSYNGDSIAELHEDTKIIVGQAFWSYDKADTIIIPKGLQRIGFNDWYYHKFSKIIYNGTIAEWNAIEKEEGWDSNNDNYIIYCTDGEINK